MPLSGFDVVKNIGANKDLPKGCGECDAKDPNQPQSTFILNSPLPTIIKPFPPHLSEKDVQYLHQRGALSLPPPSLQKRLICTYVAYVYPYMPAINLDDLLIAVDYRRGCERKISLLLYQAILFSAFAFIGAEYVTKAGYTSRRLARTDTFQKARLLYDFDCEPDHQTVIQALLLMSYGFESPNDVKDPSHWIGLAVSLAQTLGLDSQSPDTSLTPDEKTLRRRIWWACLMRDQLVALATRQPVSIANDDWDAQTLTATDFPFYKMYEKLGTLPASRSMLLDYEGHKDLTEMCIQKSKLCTLIRQMLRTQYSLMAQGMARTDSPSCRTMMLFPSTQETRSITAFNKIDSKLRLWYSALPPSCWQGLMGVREEPKKLTSIGVHGNVLHMLYWATVSALHRSLLISSSSSNVQCRLGRSSEESRTLLRVSAEHITRIVAEMHAVGSDRFLPTTGIIVILQAMMTHLLDMRGHNSERKTMATAMFIKCIPVMDQLRDIYAGADFATEMLRRALWKLSIQLSPTHTGLSLHCNGQIHKPVETSREPNVSPTSAEEHYESSEDGRRATSLDLVSALPEFPASYNQVNQKKRLPFTGGGLAEDDFGTCFDTTRTAMHCMVAGSSSQAAEVCDIDHSRAQTPLDAEPLDYMQFVGPNPPDNGSRVCWVLDGRGVSLFADDEPS